MGEGDSHGAALWLIDEYDVFVIDIYSCDRPQLVRVVDGVVVECEPEVVSERIFPASECAIVFVVGCLVFGFVSPLVARRVSFSSVSFRRRAPKFTVSLASK